MIQKCCAAYSDPQIGSEHGETVQELGTMDNNSLHAGLVVTVLVKFLYLFAASMLLGLSFGLGTSFLMKRAKSNSVPQVCTWGSVRAFLPHTWQIDAKYGPFTG